jgi:uncharacterized membrane protein
MRYHNLPATVPTHYNLAGKVDSYGSKMSLFLLPLLSFGMYVGLTYLNRFPHIFNYLTDITSDNARRQYTVATRMIRYLKFGLVIVFGYIQFMTFEIASGSSDALKWWFFPLVFIITLASLIYFVIASLKSDRYEVDNKRKAG